MVITSSSATVEMVEEETSWRTRLANELIEEATLSTMMAKSSQEMVQPFSELMKWMKMMKYLLPSATRKTRRA